MLMKLTAVRFFKVLGSKYGSILPTLIVLMYGICHKVPFKFTKKL